MKFSVIIPTRNAESQLHITLDSLVSQTCCDYECIIMDNESCDQTQSVATQYKALLPAMTFHSAPDHGIYDAMNKGVQYAQGEYILFLGAGDKLHDASVLTKVKHTLEQSKPDVLYGDIFYLPDQTFHQIETLNNRYFASGKMICHQSIFAKKETLVKHPFDLRFPFGADRNWLIQTFREENTFLHVPFIVADYAPDGFTSNPKNRKAVWMESGKILKQYYGFLMLPITFIKYYLVIKWRNQ